MVEVATMEMPNRALGDEELVSMRPLAAPVIVDSEYVPELQQRHLAQMYSKTRDEWRSFARDKPVLAHINSALRIEEATRAAAIEHDSSDVLQMPDPALRFLAYFSDEDLRKIKGYIL